MSTVITTDRKQSQITLVFQKSKQNPKKSILKVADLFCGIGGFHMAFHNLGAKVVFASDIDQPARKTYLDNYYKTNKDLFDSGNFVGDICEVDPKKIPDFDILCGGFPCQPFSQAGFKKGFSDMGRGNLFFEIVRLLKAKKPKAFFLENVRHLEKHDDGKTLSVIKRVLEEDLGYTFKYKIVKASDFGLPQHRPRIYMIGFRKDKLKKNAPRFEFPKPIKPIKTISDIFGGKCDKKVGYTLRCGGRGSGVGDRRNWDSYMIDEKERRMTPKEGREMMGFPKSFVFNVSDTQAMKQLGNSVAVPAIQATANQMIDYINKYFKTNGKNT